MSTQVLSCAQHLVHQSMDNLDRGQHVKSWALTVPARAAFACAAVISAVETPFAMLGVLFQSLQFVFTWGRSSIDLENSLQNLDLTINQSLNATIGALISPQLGSFLHTNRAKIFESMLITMSVAAVAFAAIKIAPKIAPNLIFLSSEGDWTFGWTWWR